MINISASPGGEEENRKQSAVSVDSRMDFFLFPFFRVVALLVRASRFHEKPEKQRILRANQFTIEPAVFTDKMFFFARCYRKFIHRHKNSYFALIHSSLYNVSVRNAPVKLRTVRSIGIMLIRFIKTQGKLITARRPPVVHAHSNSV